MGDDRVTAQNLKVVLVDPERNSCWVCAAPFLVAVAVS